MAKECLLLLFVVFYFLIPLSAADEMEDCPKFPCGRYGELHFPFTNTYRLECGLYVKGCENTEEDGFPRVLMGNGKWYNITGIYQKEEEYSLSVVDDDLGKLLPPNTNCNALEDTVFPPLVSVSAVTSSGNPMIFLMINNSFTFWRCKFPGINPMDPHYTDKRRCDDYYLYDFGDPVIEEHEDSCSIIQLPVRSPPDPLHTFESLTNEINIKVVSYADFSGANVSSDRTGCTKRTGRPRIIGLAIGCTAAVGLLIIFMLYKRRYITSKFRYQSRNFYADPSLNSDPENSIVFFGIPVFSYKELQEATNNFDSARELGDGGFGTVYYGKLRDGREVAIKRLYEHNYRRVEQFLNEIAILTRLRHRNLVSFYGCTSRNSRELLLVYEYIPNGTVACHLHGDLAKRVLMPWPLRMKIAIEIASALAYLHASDIIHRDVKTNNILLDNSFCVKVADFGLSRLFPNNVTHISTAPQGTPGYVDPEYRQFYQLTNKSDVYSFGVVLIELISSLPAVDTDRQRDEINLANLAIKKIENFELSELVDPSLGFGTDIKVKRMIESVAELALQCLQLVKEYRPSMDEILEKLKRIESGKEKDEPNYLGRSDVHVNEISIHVDGASNRYVRSPKPHIHRTI